MSLAASDELIIYKENHIHVSNFSCSNMCLWQIVEISSQVVLVVLDINGRLNTRRLASNLKCYRILLSRAQSFRRLYRIVEIYLGISLMNSLTMANNQVT